MTYDQTTLGNAVVMLDVYRDGLEKAGLREQALTLKGLEIFDRGGVEIALEVARTPCASHKLERVRRYLVEILERASAELQQLVA